MLRTYEIRKGNGWFTIFYSRISNINIYDILKDININDYNIYKASWKFKRVTVNELYEEKYSKYIFIKNNYDNTEE